VIRTFSTPRGIWDDPDQKGIRKKKKIKPKQPSATKTKSKGTGSPTDSTGNATTATSTPSNNYSNNNNNNNNHTRKVKREKSLKYAPLDISQYRGWDTLSNDDEENETWSHEDDTSAAIATTSNEENTNGRDLNDLSESSLIPSSDPITTTETETATTTTDTATTTTDNATSVNTLINSSNNNNPSTDKVVMKAYDGRRIQDADYKVKLAIKRKRRLAQQNIFHKLCRTCPSCRQQFGGHTRMITHLKDSARCFNKCETLVQRQILYYIKEQHELKQDRRDRKKLYLLSCGLPQHQQYMDRFNADKHRNNYAPNVGLQLPSHPDPSSSSSSSSSSQNVDATCNTSSSNNDNENEDTDDTTTITNNDVHLHEAMEESCADDVEDEAKDENAIAISAITSAQKSRPFQ
jgi:hypothetical protein